MQIVIILLCKYLLETRVHIIGDTEVAFRAYMGVPSYPLGSIVLACRSAVIPPSLDLLLTFAIILAIIFWLSTFIIPIFGVEYLHGKFGYSQSQFLFATNMFRSVDDNLGPEALQAWNSSCTVCVCVCVLLELFVFTLCWTIYPFVR